MNISYQCIPILGFIFYLFYEHSLVDPGISGFTHGPGGPTYNNRSVVSYHIYCAPTDRQGNPRNIYECDCTTVVMTRDFTLFSGR